MRLHALNNYGATMAVVSGLHHPAVLRLKRTYKVSDAVPCREVGKGVEKRAET